MEAIVRVELAVPPEVSVTGVVTEQVAGYIGLPLVAVIAQVTATEPEKPLTDVSVTAAVLPVVAPELKLSDDGVAANVKEGAVKVTTTFPGIAV